MFNLETLDVAIGLSLLFLISSLIASAFNEAIEAVLKMRAGDLERGLREMLDDRSGNDLTKSLMDHGQIFSLFAGTYDPTKLVPSRVRSFLSRFLYTITLGWLGAAQPEKSVTTFMPWRERKNLPSYIPAGQFASALLDTVARGPGNWPYPVDPSALTVEKLRSATAIFPNERVRRALLSAIDFAGNDLAAVKANVERWFDGSMDRVSGWYKRRTQYFLFAIGLVMAGILNLDALTITKHLVNDRALREAFVAKAETVHAAGTEPAGDLKAWQGALEDLGTPIGWVWENDWPVPAPQRCIASGNSVACATANVDWTFLIIGWLLTAAAVTIGAPFWFDMLNRLMVIRSTVKPHEKSPEESSEDRQTQVQAPAGPGAQQGAATAPVAPPSPPPIEAPPDPPFVPETWAASFVNKTEIAL